MNFSTYKKICVTNWELSHPNINTYYKQHYTTKHNQNTTPASTNRKYKKPTNGENYDIIVM